MSDIERAAGPVVVKYIQAARSSALPSQTLQSPAVYSHSLSAMSTNNGLGYVSVDVPCWMQATLGTHLAALEQWILAGYPKARMGRTQKEAGGHVTDWWLDVSFDSQSQTKSRVRFGETDYAAVNGTPHLWANAKKDYACFSLDLLKRFLAAMAAPAEPARRPPLPPPALGLPSCVPEPPAAPAPPTSQGTHLAALEQLILAAQTAPGLSPAAVVVKEYVCPATCRHYLAEIDKCGEFTGRWAWNGVEDF